MGLEGPLCGFGEGDGSLAASMGARAGGELDTQPDLDTARPGCTARPMSVYRAQQLQAAAGLVQSRNKTHG